MRRRFPFRHRWVLVAGPIALVGLLGVTGCGDEADVGDERAAQVRVAATEAGLGPEIAEFLAVAARGAVSTYQVTYPGTEDGSDIVLANQPPDRRVDVVVEGTIVETRIALGGQAFVCTRSGTGEETPAQTTCTRTDAIVEGPGLLSDGAVDDLTAALSSGLDDYDFSLRTAPIAGVEATCLVTRLREGREGDELGARGSLCVSDRGAVLRVARDGDVLEAGDYTTDIPENTFVRPDRGDDE